jgi:hypothetical protein
MLFNVGVGLRQVGPVARLLAAHPEGLHPDGVSGTGYLVPGLIGGCQRFTELTGEVGDVYLLHPFVLHPPRDP